MARVHRKQAGRAQLPAGAKIGSGIYKVPLDPNDYHLVKYWRAVFDNAQKDGNPEEIAHVSRQLTVAVELERKYKTTEAQQGKDMGELVAWADIMPPMERMLGMMATGARGVVLRYIREAAPELKPLDARELANRACDEMFQAWDVEALREAANS